MQALERVGYAGFTTPFVALDIIVSLVLVWYLVAWQGLIGVCFFIFVFVYDTLAAHKAGDVRKKAAAQTDKRLEIMKEIIAGIRVVKMYAWEGNFMDLVAEIRRFVSGCFSIKCRKSSLYALLWPYFALWLVGKLAPFSHLQRGRTNTNRDLLAHNFAANDVIADLMINDDDDDKL